MNQTPLSLHLMMVLAMIGLIAACDTATSVNKPVSATQQIAHPASSNGDLQTPPTNTPSPRVTSSQTHVAFDEATYDATQSVVRTEVAQFPRVCRADYSRPNFSPNGLWMEELCYSENDRDLVMTLSNQERQVLWKLLYRDYIPPMDIVPDGGMAVVHWSNDERYAYFFSFLNSSGGECFYDGGDRGFGLFRIDLLTGEVTTLLPPSNSFWWYGFSFSPTDRRLVYGARARDLRILDMTTGDLISILSASSFDEGGGFLWSSDGSKLVYSTVRSWDQGEKFNYTLRSVDAQSGSEQILLESSTACYEAIAWTENNPLILEKNYNEALLEFDLNSNKVIGAVTATPFP